MIKRIAQITFVAILICGFVFPNVPISNSGVSAATYSHSMVVKKESNKTYKQFTVKDGKSFQMPAALPKYRGFTFSGWNAYRVNDKKYYVAKHGWVTAKEAEKKGYTYKLYKAKTSWKLDSSWTKGCKKANFVFYPVYECRVF